MDIGWVVGLHTRSVPVMWFVDLVVKETLRPDTPDTLPSGLPNPEPGGGSFLWPISRSCFLPRGR